jgi:hypothetical protein
MTQRTPVPSHLQEDVVMATERQASYLEGLRDGKDLTTLTPEQRAWLDDADFTKVPKSRASDIIGKLKELPWKPGEADQPRFAEMMNLGVKTGRYAIPGEDGALRFYSVKRDETKMAMWVDVWASDARYPIRAIPQRIEILEAIAADPDAGPRFGREIGKCYICGRTLTDETSRELGIGPVCRDGL